MTIAKHTIHKTEENTEVCGFMCKGDIETGDNGKFIRSMKGY